MESRDALILLTTMGGLAISVSGQNVPGVEQGEALRRQQESRQLMRDLRQNKVSEAPLINPDEAFDIGPQYILKSQWRHKWFELTLDSQFSWTDNMFYNERDVVDPVKTTLLTTSAQFNLTPPEWKFGKGRIRPRVGYQHIWMNYALLGNKTDPLSGFPKRDNDFDASTTLADLSYQVGSWQVQAGFDWQRLLGHQPNYGSYSEFYRAYSPRWSVGKLFSLGERHTLITSYLGSHSFTHVDPNPGLEDGNRNDRTEHNLLLGYGYAVTSKLAIQPLYRFQIADYNHQDRVDQLHSFSTSLTYMVTPWLFVRGFGAYELRDSSEVTTPDYRKWDAGISVSMAFRF